MSKALIYCRVSTEEQAREGYSLDAQEKFCRKYAESNGCHIAGVFRDEGKSGTNLNRPALQELLAKCQQDKSIDLVIVQETDRLARNTQDHLAIRAMLKKAGVKLISVAQPMLDDSPEGRMIDTILASVNQFQSDINSRKVKKGMPEKFDSGCYPGWAPLGYLNGNVNGKGSIIPDPERWPLIKEGFRLYLTGNYCAAEISDILYAKGVRSRTGKKICNSIMISMLNNPFYCGLMKWGGQEKMGSHKPMITRQEHWRILTILAAHNQHACRRRKHQFLLRGFVICDICGQRNTAEQHRRGKMVDYYHCAALTQKHSNKGQNIEVEKLEKQVEGCFKKIEFSPAFINLVTEKVRLFYQNSKNEKEQAQRILLNKKMHLEQKRDIAEEKLISGTLSNEDFRRISDRYKAELTRIERELEELEAQREIDIETVRKVLLLSRNIYAAYREAPHEIKRLYLGFFWDAFRVGNKKVVQAQPTKIIEALLKEKHVILRGKLCSSSKFIITLENWQYMAELKHKLLEISRLVRSNS